MTAGLHNQIVRLRLAGLALFSLVMAVVLLHPFLDGQRILLTSDAVISSVGGPPLNHFRRLLPHWAEQPLLGLAHSGSTALKDVLRSVSPPEIYNNWHHAIGMVLASLAFLAFLQKRRIASSGILLASLTLAWLGSNFTLIYAGHPNKPFVIFFFVLGLCVARTTHWRGHLLWGACCGLMFAQQPDMGLFFGLFAGAYLCFQLWQTDQWRPRQSLPVLLPAAGMALLFALGPLLGGYRQYVADAAPMQTDDPQERWDYVTQWSWPPEESIAFIAPGYTGWRSGEPAGPYWGRMGRSANWEETGQGFMNFKLENTYLGFIPLAFALFALVAARRSPYRAEIIFWGGAALLALLLAFGKYFPLYRLFYQFPVVNAVRNPNKFLQVFQVAVAILTAYGIEAWLQPGDPDTRRVRRRYLWWLLAATGVLLLGALHLTLNRTGDIHQFVRQGWPEATAAVMTGNKLRALWHAVIMAGITCAAFAIGAFPRLAPAWKYRHVLAAVLVLLVAGDAIKLSRHYVHEMPRSYIQRNPLTKFLEANLEEDRVALATQEGIYGAYLAYLLPFNQLPTFNVHDMPRMPTAYAQWLAAGSRNPLGMWRLAAVRYVLGPTALAQQVPADQLNRVFTYRVEPAADNGFRLRPDPQGDHAVFELQPRLPRYVLLADYDSALEEEALQRLGTMPLPVNGRPVGQGEVLSAQPGYAELRTEATEPAMLRAAERWTSDWRATVNDEPVTVERIDHIAQGIPLPPGTHHVVLRYAPARGLFRLQLGGYILLLAIGLQAGIHTLRKHRFPFIRGH